MNEILHEGLLKLGFDSGNFYGIKLLPLSELEKKLEKYIELLIEFNAKFDLINAETEDEIVVRHILDSLSAAKEIARLISEKQTESRKNTNSSPDGAPGDDLSPSKDSAPGVNSVPSANFALGVDFSPSKISAPGAVPSSSENFLPSENLFTVADIGSGAGLPGIPLSTAFPDVNFVLLERMTKRCAFLNHCISVLELKNVCVTENQVERIARNSFDICVFRAFRPLEKKMMYVLRRVLKDGGKLAAYKAKSQKIKEEMDALEKNAPEYTVVPLYVPFLTENSPGNTSAEIRERNLVIIEK